MSTDFYDLLGVGRDASTKDIKRAYREKAAKYHPDVSDDPNAEEKFKRIKKAKEILTDDEKRGLYDQLGHDRFEQAEKQGGFDAGRPGGFGFGGGDSPFGAGSPFEEIFEQFFGGNRRQRQRAARGPDLRTELAIDLEDAYEGFTKQVTLRRPKQCRECHGHGYPPDATARTCPQCNGQGQITQIQHSPLGRVQRSRPCPQCEGAGRLYEQSCPACGGEGVIEEESHLQVDIPRGVRDGQSLRLDGEGAPGDPGAPSGDLLIDITIRDHEEFERDGDDIHYQLPISFPQAVFGDKLKIPTLGGTVEMDVPAGTQSGERFRLRGKGMPRLRGTGYGDQYVHVQVVTPKRLNDEQRDALEAFAEAGGENVRVEEGFFERIKKSI